MVARRGISVYTGSGGTNGLTAFRFTDDGKSKTGNVTGNYDKVLHQITGTLSNLGAITSSVGFSGDGSGLTNLTASEVAAAGNTGDVQFNSGDDLAADSAFTFVPSTHTLGLGESSVSASLTASHALTINAAAASTWSTSAGALTISGTAGLTLDSAGTSAVNLGTAAYAKTITVGADESTKVDVNALAIELDSGGDIELSATADVNVPADVGLTFGDDGEKIEGDGTDLTVSSSRHLNLSTGGTVAVTGDVTVTGDSTLGDASADVATVNGRLQIGKFDPATHADAVLLETMATTPTTYNGSMIYLSVTAATGSNSGASFANPDKWYFCESGSWYPSPFNSL